MDGAGHTRSFIVAVWSRLLTAYPQAGRVDRLRDAARRRPACEQALARREFFRLPPRRGGRAAAASIQDFFLFSRSSPRPHQNRRGRGRCSNSTFLSPLALQQKGKTHAGDASTPPRTSRNPHRTAPPDRATNVTDPPLPPSPGPRNNRTNPSHGSRVGRPPGRVRGSVRAAFRPPRPGGGS